MLNRRSRRGLPMIPKMHRWGKWLRCALSALAWVLFGMGTGLSAPRVPPPLFSRQYVEATRDVLALEPRDALGLEAQLANDPNDWVARLKLISYYSRADREAPPKSGKYAELVLWLIEHKPDSEILISYGELLPARVTADQLRRADSLWRVATQSGQNNPRLMFNAATFYAQKDPLQFIACLERAVESDPLNALYAQPLGSGYANDIVHRTNLEQHARAKLASTQNPYVLEGAVKLLQSEYNRSVVMRSPETPFGDLAKQYFVRAKALDPQLDEQWIYPQVDPKMIGMFDLGVGPPAQDSARFEEGVKRIRRLAPTDFPRLPGIVNNVLRTRGCMVPQPSLEGARNVIHGEFFTRGQQAWAALCSKGGFTSLLVFRNGSDAQPEQFPRSEDKAFLQGDGLEKFVYTREITAVGSHFIVGHYRAYGGPKPPPILHQGIDDAFLEKASVTIYRYHGKWLKLQGAD